MIPRPNVQQTGTLQPGTPRTVVLPGTEVPRPVLTALQQVQASAQPIACGNGGVQRMVINPPHSSGRGRANSVSGMCIQVINWSTGAMMWEGLTGATGEINRPRLPYTGGTIVIRSKQLGLMSSQGFTNHATRYGSDYVVMARLQAGVFGDVYYENGGITAELSASLYDAATNTHPYTASALPQGCAAWPAISAPPSQGGTSFDPLIASALGDLNFAFSTFAMTFAMLPTTFSAPPTGTVLGHHYAEYSGGRCWLGAPGSGVANLPVAFSWGPTVPLTAAYTIQNGQIVDVEAAESAQAEQAMLAFGFNPGQSTLKYSGSATTDANGNFAIPYNVETIGIGVFTVRRRGYRIGRVHRTQGGYRFWQRIDPAGPSAPNRQGDCLIGRAVVTPNGTAMDITYRFKGSAC